MMWYWMDEEIVCEHDWAEFQAGLAWRTYRRCGECGATQLLECWGKSSWRWVDCELSG